MSSVASAKGGLEGVVAGASALCDIDGRTGRLLYCGYDIVDLAEHSSFEETAYLLWHGELPSTAQLDELRSELRDHLDPQPAVWDLARAAGPSANPMAVLRTQVSLLGALDAEAEDNSEPANRRKAARLVAQVGTLVAGTERIQQGLHPIAPRRDLGIAANFLYMLRGTEADADEVRSFDVALVLHAEHGMNASTFAARVTAATLSDMHSAITSAIGALKGPLHGGANERVMELLRELSDVSTARGQVSEMLAQKRRIMGFGHRVYRTEDPRATILRRYSRSLGERAGETRWYELTRAVEDAVLAEKGLYPNVDLYSASAYTSLGIPQRVFTPIFAVSRMAGWTANVIEQHRDNRLIRPDSDYIGPAPRDYVPLEARAAGEDGAAVAGVSATEVQAQAVARGSESRVAT
ncbi:MAG TPA: citrate/2-methylcitrate synthase [Candidatus Dormibacteraeota bacterium]|jgi:citrate synthase|nr:citrate/2-methylcitrate synthase [Candidatus Dormibacteraeota bacterium]